MTPAEWKRLVRPLLPLPDRWAFRGKLCYRRPVKHVLIGVFGEGSAYGGTYVWRVSMPLFIPNEALVLSWSERIGGGSNRIEDADHEQLGKAASIAIAGAYDDAAALRNLVASARDRQNIRTVEAAAYAAVLLDEVQTARTFLAAAHKPSDGPTWFSEVTKRMRAVDELLGEDDLQQARELLTSWEQRTVAALNVAVLP